MGQLDTWTKDYSGRTVLGTDGISGIGEYIGRSAIALMYDERLHQALSTC